MYNCRVGIPSPTVFGTMFMLELMFMSNQFCNRSGDFRTIWHPRLSENQRNKKQRQKIITAKNAKGAKKNGKDKKNEKCEWTRKKANYKLQCTNKPGKDAIYRNSFFENHWIICRTGEEIENKERKKITTNICEKRKRIIVVFFRICSCPTNIAFDKVVFGQSCARLSEN